MLRISMLLKVCYITYLKILQTRKRIVILQHRKELNLTQKSRKDLAVCRRIPTMILR